MKEAKILFVLCVAALGLTAAVCGSPQRTQVTPEFPGPAELKANPSYSVLVDATDMSGDPLLVLGAQITFDELRAELIPKLVANGWQPSAYLAPEDAANYFGAEKDGMCIDYLNMNPGAWMAPFLRAEARRANSGFEQASRNYVTIFRVGLLDECP